MVSVSIFEVLRQFKCFEVNESTIKPLGVFRNLPNIEGSALYKNNVSH